MDTSKRYLNNYLAQIELDEFSQENLQYLIDGLNAIKHDDEKFVNDLMVDHHLKNAFLLYCKMSHDDFYPGYQKLSEEKFRVAFDENYQTFYEGPLNHLNVETFDWVSEFTEPQKG